VHAFSPVHALRGARLPSRRYARYTDPVPCRPPRFASFRQFICSPRTAFAALSPKNHVFKRSPRPVTRAASHGHHKPAAAVLAAAVLATILAAILHHAFAAIVVSETRNQRYVSETCIRRNVDGTWYDVHVFFKISIRRYEK